MCPVVADGREGPVVADGRECHETCSVQSVYPGQVLVASAFAVSPAR